ncbi:MAG: alpha/beta hydrolase [Verrucomicrobiota bacterium]
MLRPTPILASFLLLASTLLAETKKNIPYRDLDEAYAKERCVLDIALPDKKDDFATIIYFHGGALKNGNKSIPTALLGQGHCIVAPNYRLYPKATTRTAIEDASAAVAWVFKNIESHGGDTSKIFISGHSAGGYLASMVGLDKSYLAVHDIDANSVAGLIPLSGHCITHMTVREENSVPFHQAIIDEYAPVYHVRKDAPPMLLITGDRELEMGGRYEENAYHAAMMKVAGHTETRLIEIGGWGHGMVPPALPLLLKEVDHILQASN